MPHRHMDEGECLICEEEEMVNRSGPYRGLCSECTVIAQENPD